MVTLLVSVHSLYMFCKEAGAFLGGGGGGVDTDFWTGLTWYDTNLSKNVILNAKQESEHLTNMPAWPTQAHCCVVVVVTETRQQWVWWTGLFKIDMYAHDAGDII